MNIVEFLNAVDAAANAKTKEDLVLFIHELACACEESERARFLLKLGNCQEEKAVPETSSLNEKLAQIESMELYLVSSYREEYYASEDPDEYTEYHDILGIGNILAEAFTSFFALYDQKLYAEAQKLGERLFSLSILVQAGDDLEDEELTVFDLRSKELLHADLDKFAKVMLSLAYLTSEESERCKNVYKICKNSLLASRVAITDLLQVGNIRQEEFLTFVEDCLQYLGEIEEDVSAKMFNRALCLIGDTKKIVHYTLCNINTHPGAYLAAIYPSESFSKEEKIRYGISIVQKMDERFVLRSTLALRVGDLLCHTDEDEALRELCLRAAFASTTTGCAYLRYWLHSTNPEKNAVLEEIFREVKERSTTKKKERFFSLPPAFSFSHSSSHSASYFSTYSFGEYTENTCLEDDIACLSFLLGNFTEVFDRYVLVQTSSWFGTYQKEFMAFFLFLMLEKNGLGPGVQNILRGIKKLLHFSKENYLLGLNRTDSKEDEDTLLVHVLEAWKKTVTLSLEEKRRFLDTMKDIMRERVKDVMKNNVRQSYRACAEFLAAIGEVEESWGVTAAKQVYLLNYKTDYPRRVAFIRELRALGLRS